MNSETGGRDFFTPISLGVLGTAALCLTLLMNFYFGSSLAVDETAQHIQGLASIVIDCMVIAFALTTGALMKKKLPMAALMIGIFTAGFVGYSFTSTAGFGAAQRIAVTDRANADMATRNSLAMEKNKAALAARAETLSWMKKTLLTTEGRTERRNLVEAIAKLSNEPIALEAIEDAPRTSDIQANVVAVLLSKIGIQVEPESVQIAMIVALSFLLVAGKAVCFGFASYLWPAKKTAVAIAVTEIETPTIAAIEPQKLVFPKYAPLPDWRAEREAIAWTGNDSSFPDDQALSDTLAGEVEAIRASLRNAHQDVADFFGERTVRVTGSRERAGDVYRDYVAWAHHHGKESVSQNRFGRICTSLAIARDDSVRSQSYYLDIEIVRDGQEDVLAEAA